MSAWPGCRRGTHGPGRPGRARPRATASSIARAGRACDGRRATWRRICRSSTISGLTVRGLISYMVFIDGGLCLRAGLAGFDGHPSFGLDFSARQGLPGVLSSSGVGLVGWLAVLGALRCPLLFDNFIGRKRNVDGGVLAAGLLGSARRREALRENCTDGHVFRFIAFRAFGSGTDVFGTRRDGRAKVRPGL